MDIEKARGISISSAALQFEYDGTVINLVDTPGHADFSEDTYRVLAAVDSAVMLVDAAKGMEPQTLKLFEVCRHRRIPVLTVINKWDRPGHDALQLMDEVFTKTGLKPTPLTWPVGIAGDFRGVLDRRTGTFIQFTRTAGGATLATQTRMTPDEALAAHGEHWTTAVEESELLERRRRRPRPRGLPRPPRDPGAVRLGGPELRRRAAARHAASSWPPRPARARTRPASRGRSDSPFSGFVFKIQAGMDSAHRDRLAYIRVCSGVFERGSVVTHCRRPRSRSRRSTPSRCSGRTGDRRPGLPR